jgi:hypothetical protein
LKLSKNSVVLTAAFTGLLSGTAARAAAPQDTSKQDTTKSKKATSKASKATAKVEKHSCAGQNSCKGLGGCKAGDQGCAGKNTCKGKGGCATDGK